MGFDLKVERATRALARKRNIEPELLLAVVEVECSGEPFERDGVTPRFLFERHKFYEYLRKYEPEKLQIAVTMGLAIPHRNRRTQYKDLGTSAGRKRVLASAESISVEGAYWASSWGLGQIMGFNAKKLGYGSATQMVSELRVGGLSAQIDCFWRFLETMGIVPFLKNKKWDTVALRYNGPAYADNDYDTRLEASYARWKARSVGEDPEELEDIPLGRTPVQNAEPTSVWKTPEGVSTAVASGTGILATVKPESPDGRGPMDYALAIIIVVCVVVGAYYFIHRLRRSSADD